MELRVLTNNVGCYNLLNPSQKTFEFSLAIVEDGEYQAIEIDGVRAVLQFSGEPEDKSDFDDPIDNLGSVFTKCFEFADKVWSTRDYRSQCLLFAKLYQENLDSMDAAMLAKHKEKTQNKIDQLQKELGWDAILYDLTYEINSAIQAKISKIKKSVAFKEKELSELKEDSESYGKSKKTLDGYLEEIKKLESQIIPEKQ